MPSGTNMLVTVNTADFAKFAMPVPVNDGELTRETTVFHLIAEDQSLSFLGTYDQILDFLAEIGQKVMSWPIVAGKQDWFSNETESVELVEVRRANRDREPAGSEVRNSRDQGAGASSDRDNPGSEGA